MNQEQKLGIAKDKIKHLEKQIDYYKQAHTKKVVKKMKKAARVSQEDTLKMLRAEISGLAWHKRLGLAVGMIVGRV